MIKNLLQTLSIKDMHGRINAVNSWIADMNARPEVFTKDITGEIPVMFSMQVMMFASDSEVVLLFYDEDARNDDCELADNEGDSTEEFPSLWFTEHSHRISPIRRIMAAREAFKCTLSPDMVTRFRIVCMMVTRANIINYDDVVPDWSNDDIYVMHETESSLLSYADDTANGESAGAAAYARLQIGLETGAASLCYDDILKEYREMVCPKSTLEDTPTPADDDDDFDFYLDEMLYEITKPEDDPDEEKTAPIEDYFDPEDPDFSDIETGFAPDGTPVNIKKRVVMPAVRILKPLDNAQAALDDMVGLEALKKHISDLLMLHRYNQKLSRISPSAKTHKVNLHTCFIGGVGTGKTTVGRLMGAILAKAGVLSKGHVVIASRGAFIGKTFGSEEENVRKVMKLAQGGVLLIDEAYLLNGNHHEDPGKMVLQLMLDLLADEKNRDICVILCGYSKPMEALLAINPGLRSRFVNTFEFPDFSASELLEITKRKIAKFGYKFTRQGWIKYCQTLQGMYAGRDKTWANGREVARLLDRVYIEHAKRCVSSDVSGRAIYSLTARDIPAVEVSITTARQIGFR